MFNSGAQGVYVYNSLADFYTDANAYLANPNRTTGVVTLRKFDHRYNNIPGQEKPLQPLDVFYTGAYVQDDWRVKDNFTLSAGLRFDVPIFGDNGFTNVNADAMTFRDENGNPTQYKTGELPPANILWSPRLGFNWDVNGNQTTQVRGGTGIFTGRPAYVWISNQVGNTGMLTGTDFGRQNVTNRFFHPESTALGARRHGRAGGQHEPGADHPGLQVPAGVAHQHRHRPEAAGRLDGHAGIHLQPRRQRALLREREPAGGADDLRRRRPAHALDVDNRINNISGQADQHGRRPEEPEHRPVLELGGHAREAFRGGPLGQDGLQLR